MPGLRRLVPPLALAACAAPAKPPAPTVDNHAPAPHVASTGVAPLADGVEILLATDGDVDGDGMPEAVQLRSNGLLVVGGRSLPVPLDPIPDRDFFASDAALHVIELDRRRGLRAVVLTTPTEGIEDPPHRHRIFVVDGDDVREVMDAIAATPRSGLRFPGDGTARYDEGAWPACERQHYPKLPVGIDEIVLAPDGDGTYRESGRRPTGRTFDCDDLAACPFVYVVGEDGARKVGEVLRNVRGADAYTLQSLVLPEPTGAVLTLRIAEEKQEVTYLDELFVEIGGVRHAPRACDVAAPPAYCAPDHVPYVLREGDVLDLEVEVEVTGPAAVFARGYYVPLGSGG